MESCAAAAAPQVPTPAPAQSWAGGALRALPQASPRSAPLLCAMLRAAALCTWFVCRCPALLPSSSHCIITCCDHSAEVNVCCPGEFSSGLTSPPRHCSHNSHQTAASSHVHCWASPCKQHMGLPSVCTKGTIQGTGDLEKYH